MKNCFFVLTLAMMIVSQQGAIAAESQGKKNAQFRKLAAAETAPGAIQVANAASSQKTAVDPNAIGQVSIENKGTPTSNVILPGATPDPTASPVPGATPAAGATPPQMPPMLSFPTSGAGGGSGSASPSGNMGQTSNSNPSSYPSYMTSLPTNVSRGAMGSCKSAPPADALKKAREYYDNNRNLIEKGNFTRSGDSGKKIVINDYTQNPPQMFVFDTRQLDKDGTPKCIMSWPVDWGSGAGGSIVPGCSNESHLTPPGFHITTEHVAGSKYPYPRGVGMVSCEGQGSHGRGVLVHAGPGRGQGRGITWGCPAISDSNFQTYLQEVRGGSLMYNYFGDQKERNAAGCSSSVGSMENQKCNSEVSPGSYPNVRSQQNGVAQ